MEGLNITLRKTMLVPCTPDQESWMVQQLCDTDLLLEAGLQAHAKHMQSACVEADSKHTCPTVSWFATFLSRLYS